ncbi:hypothetical protein WA556_000314, partial [Blastocystis sp. ATCC 50177/Nand II]
MLVQLYLDFELIPFNISTCTTVMDIKKHISKTYSLPVSDQKLIFCEKEMNDNDLISSLNIHENDVITVESKSHQQMMEYQRLLMDHPVEQYAELYRTSPGFQAAVKAIMPMLEPLIVENKKDELIKAILEAMINACIEHEDDMGEEPMGEMDSMEEESPEMQQKILQQIQKHNISRANAVSVPVKIAHIYVPTKINGVQVNFVVDTGAQRTILDLDTAQATSVVRVLDEKMKVEMRGIGKNTSVGNINAFDICIEGEYFATTCQVMPQDEFAGVCLLGLDFLKLYKAVIDLVNGTLTLEINGKKVTTKLIESTSIKPLDAIPSGDGMEVETK